MHLEDQVTLGKLYLVPIYAVRLPVSERPNIYARYTVYLLMSNSPLFWWMSDICFNKVYFVLVKLIPRRSDDYDSFDIMVRFFAPTIRSSPVLLLLRHLVHMVIVVIHFPSTLTTLTLQVENGSLFFFFVTLFIIW